MYSTPDPDLKTLAGKRRQVWSGRARSTIGGLRRVDLVENRRGKIVSRKKSIAGKRASKPLDVWRECLHEAAIAHNCPFHIAAKGTAVHRYAKKRYIERTRSASPLRGRRSTGRRTTGRRSTARSRRSTTGRRTTGRRSTGRRTTAGSRSTTGRRTTGRRSTAGRSSGTRRRSNTGRRESGGRRLTDAGRRANRTSGQSRPSAARRANADHGHCLDDEDSDCAICMQSSNEARKHCQCGHSFHSRCLKRWLRTNDTCPLCRGVC